MKEMQKSMNRQHDLLRLIVQKMDITEEREDEEDYLPTYQSPVHQLSSNPRSTAANALNSANKAI